MTRIAITALLFALTASLGAQTTKDERIATLKYGIEPEVLDLVKALKQEKNTEFRDLLLTAYPQAKTDDLKEALLLLFLDQKDKGLEGAAVGELANPDKKGNSLLLNAVSYLTEIHSDQVKDTLVTLLSGKNKVLALAAIRALGKLGATDKIDDLIKLYNDAETDPNYKPDLIWAFGEMKATAALDLMLKEYDDAESQPLLRRSILEALGKVGDAKGWDRVKDALADKNTDVRAAAVASLSAFSAQANLPELLTAALRDPAPAVRQAGATAAKAAKPADLEELLAYRAKKDPDPKVKVEALRALAEYPDGEARVLGFLADRKGDFAVWREALTLSLDKKFTGSLDTLKAVIAEDVKDKNGGLSGTIATATLPQRDLYRILYGLILASDKVPARQAALRAIGLGHFTEFEPLLKTMAAKDTDPGIKAQAQKVLDDWNKPADAPKSDAAKP